MKHRETHPVDVEGCFGCKLLSVSIAPSAAPGRHPEAASGVARDRRWSADMDAYRRLRRQGLQPPRIDGCATLERHADHRLQVEMGQLGDAKKFAEGERLSQDLGVAS